MYYKGTTQVPNELLDISLPYLNQAQLKVILVVIRQTLGWIDSKTGKRKRKDWISLSFFVRRTGLTRKSISLAIQTLIDKELLVALDYHERELRTAKDRRGKKRIYYAYAPYFRLLKTKGWVKKLSKLFTYRPITKPTPTKNRQYFNNNTKPTPVSHDSASGIQSYEDFRKFPP